MTGRNATESGAPFAAAGVICSPSSRWQQLLRKYNLPTRNERYSSLSVNLVVAPCSAQNMVIYLLKVQSSASPFLTATEPVTVFN